METPCRILLTSDSILILEGLLKLLEEFDGAEIQATARRDAAEALAAEWQPTIVVSETSDVAALAGFLERLRSAAPDAQYVLIAPANREQFLAAVLAGAHGFVGRHASAQELINCIRAVQRGDWGLPRSLIGDLVQEYVTISSLDRAPVASDWTDREIAVLRLLGQGLGAQQIGQALYLSESTVRTIISTLLRKLGVGNRVQAFTEALRRGLIVLE